MQIIKEKKYKNISLTVNTKGEVIIKAPLFCNDNYIDLFYKKHQKWIDNRIEFINKQNCLKEKYDFNKYIYLFNKPILKNNSFDLKTSYIDIFYNHIPNLLNFYSNKLGLKYNNLKITTSKHIWGSLDNKKQIKLNLFITILPIELVEYIIIHELCHIKHFNHSKSFWSLVEYYYCPDYKQKRKKLKKYSFILTL